MKEIRIFSRLRESSWAKNVTLVSLFIVESSVK